MNAKNQSINSGVHDCIKSGRLKVRLVCIDWWCRICGESSERHFLWRDNENLGDNSQQSLM